MTEGEIMGSIKKQLNIMKEYLLIKWYKLLKWVSHGSYVNERQKELLKSLKPGDVIYAKMPFSDRTLASIDKGHRNRPYLVVNVENDVVYAYPSSHKKRKSTSKYLSYCLKKEVYKTYLCYGETRKSVNDSWISLDTLHKLPADNVYYKSLEVNENDLQKIERNLVMHENRGKSVKRFNCDVPIMVGDMVYSDHQKYYVYQTYNDRLFTHPVEKQETEHSYRIHGKPGTRYINISKKHELIKDESCMLLDYLGQEDVEAIDEKKKLIKVERKNVQKNDDKINKMTFLYAPGTMLLQPFQDEYVVYLYSVGDRSYGAYYDEFCKGYNVLHKVEGIKHFKDVGTIDQEELLDLMEGLIEDDEYENNKIYYKYILDSFCAQNVLSLN